jgi:hypothetical protein
MYKVAKKWKLSLLETFANSVPFFDLNIRSSFESLQRILKLVYKFFLFAGAFLKIVFLQLLFPQHLMMLLRFWVFLCLNAVQNKINIVN